MLFRFLNAFLLAFCLFSATKSFASNANEVGEGNKTKMNNSPKDDTLRYTKTPQIEVIGKSKELDRLPGSAAIISAAEINAINPISGNEVLRRVTGVHVVDEEGIGLRANIGIRGLDPDRSKTTLMLEDGIPVSLMPYSEPEMYYTPSIDRMSGVEVLKGSGSILYGPNTIGGVINYLTPDPSRESRAMANVRGGEGGLFSANLGYGTTVGNAGFQINYLRKRADRINVTGFDLHDLTAKLKMAISDESSLGFKFGIYDEQSDATYVGMTNSMFESGNYDFTPLPRADALDVRRYAASMTHDWTINSNVSIKTNVYGYTTTRNWSRQDFDRAAVAGRVYDRIVGDENVPGEALFFRNSTGNRNRQFEVLGVEPRIAAQFLTGDISHKIDGGVRYMYESASEQRVNGTINNPKSGAMVSDEVRTGWGTSAFVQDKIYLDDDLVVTPGLRVENYEFERNILRQSSRDTNIVNNSNVTAFIPGFGVSYRIEDGASLFAGVHRGFSPPGITAAITNDGIDQQLDGEYSWNYELGIRSFTESAFSYEITAFMLDFSNQIIPISESVGGVGRLGVSAINGGATLHRGLEIGTTFDFAKMVDAQEDFGFSLNTNLTLTHSEFGDRNRINGTDTVNISGNRLPYAPNVMLSAALDFSTPFGLATRIGATYIGHQFTDPDNTVSASSNGQFGELPSYFILDATVSYYLEVINSTLVFSVKNLLDERYIATRRPQGIRVGLPRFFSLGLDFNMDSTK